LINSYLSLTLRYGLTSDYVLVHIFLFFKSTRLALGQNYLAIKLTTHSNLVPNLRMTGAVPPLSLACLCGVHRDNVCKFCLIWICNGTLCCVTCS